MGGTGGASPRTIYGVSVTDTTITARAITPANAWANQMFDAATITDKQDLADAAALARAAQHLLAHLRGTVLAGSVVEQYAIGNMSVTRGRLAEILKDAIEEEKDAEARLLPLLLSTGTRKDQGTLTIENPIEQADGSSRIELDELGFGSIL